MNILITGGASGVGESITRRLAGNTQDIVYFTYCRSAAKATALCSEFANVTKINCDFTDPDSLKALIQTMDGLDIDALVNNAISGVVRNHFHKIAPGGFVESFQHNVLPTLAITQQAIRGFRKKKFGKIVNILSSALVNKPPIGWSEYTANKAYLAAMSKSWATEYVKFNITSNSISPSFMSTDFNQSMDPRIIEQITENHPLHRLLEPAEVAEAVAFLLQTTQHINGTNLVINAGSDVI